MKTNRKPDLMLLLALFVLIGVVVSTLSSNEGSASSVNIQQQDATLPIRTQNKAIQKNYRGHLLPVSASQ